MPGNRFIDTKIPLTWLLGIFGTLLTAMGWLIWMTAIQVNKIDQVLATVAEQRTVTDRRFVSTDTRVDTLANNLASLSLTVARADDRHDLRIENIETALGLKIPVRK